MQYRENNTLANLFSNPVIFIGSIMMFLVWFFCFIAALNDIGKVHHRAFTEGVGILILISPVFLIVIALFFWLEQSRRRFHAVDKELYATQREVQIKSNMYEKHYEEVIRLNQQVNVSYLKSQIAKNQSDRQKYLGSTASNEESGVSFHDDDPAPDPDHWFHRMVMSKLEAGNAADITHVYEAVMNSLTDRDRMIDAKGFCVKARNSFADGSEERKFWDAIHARLKRKIDKFNSGPSPTHMEWR